MKYNIVFLLLIMLVSCTPKPEPIDYGKDVCDFCKMNITDNKFAAELITHKGKVFKFDAIECLFNYKKNYLQESQVHSEYVNDFSMPGELIDLTKAYFLKSEVFRSPMGLNVLSFESKDSLEKIKMQNGGTELSYQEVFKLALDMY